MIDQYHPIDLYAFYRPGTDLTAFAAAGITGLVIDWEAKNKNLRQAGFNTEINLHSASDLTAACAQDALPVLCRINGPNLYSQEEVDIAASSGAKEIILPMVRSAEQVEAALDAIGGRCQLAIMIETKDAVENAHLLSHLPISRVYVGLNDLCIDRGSHNLFEPLIDGTLEHLREEFRIPLGYAGLTHADSGSPIPCHLLIYKMASLGCNFTFLRRSFYHDLKHYSAEQITGSITNYLKGMDRLSERQHQTLSDELIHFVQNRELVGRFS